MKWKKQFAQDVLIYSGRMEARLTRTNTHTHTRTHGCTMSPFICSTSCTGRGSSCFPVNYPLVLQQAEASSSYCILARFADPDSVAKLATEKKKKKTLPGVKASPSLAEKKQDNLHKNEKAMKKPHRPRRCVLASVVRLLQRLSLSDRNRKYV